MEAERGGDGGGEEEAAASGHVRVGYALLAKRESSFMRPELVSYGLSRGVTFVRILPHVPLEQQGPFHLILHKLESEEWAANLKSFSSKHPEVVVVDQYDAVHRLNDRRQMLEAVEKLDPAELGAKFLVPRQLMVEGDVAPETLGSLVQEEGFPLPAVAKPTAANGSNSAHALSLVLSRAALGHVEPPLILQEFINHGGVLFKLYVLGDLEMVFRRHSLPDIPSQEEGGGTSAAEVVALLQGRKKGEAPAPHHPRTHKDHQGLPDTPYEENGLVQLNRISNEHLTEEELRDSRVTDPPPELMRSLGMALKRLLGLHAFNVDILREGGHGDRYYIVDINYMPGYEKMPDFPSLMVDFILARVAARQESLRAAGAQATPEALLLQELSTPLLPPQQPYPVLMGKKKWVLFRAAAKLCGLEHRNRQAASRHVEKS